MGEQVSKESMEVRPDGAQLVLDGRQTAALLGVTLRSVQNYVRERGLPQVGRDRYDGRAVLLWREASLRAELAETSRSAEEKRLIKAQADEREQKAALAAMERAQREGELLDKREVEGRWLARIYAVKTALKAACPMIARAVAGQSELLTVEATVRRELQGVCRRFAGEDDQAAAGAVLAERIAAALEALWPARERAKQRAAIVARLGSDPWGACEREEEAVTVKRKPKVKAKRARVKRKVKAKAR